MPFFPEELTSPRLYKHRENEDTSMKMLNCMYSDLIHDRRKKIKILWSSLLIHQKFFKCQLLDRVKQIVKKAKDKMVSAPNNWT